MPASSKKKTARARVRQLLRRLFPRTWVLRADLRRSDRIYRPLIDKAEGHERERLIAEYMDVGRGPLEEELDGIQTQRLIRRAWRYYIVAPEKPYGSEDHEDENWIRGWASGTWYLKPAGVAALQRQIEEANKRRLEVWEGWVKILTAPILLLIALVSAFASLILA